MGNATYGRVQIRRQDETWGSICDDHWGSAEAKVVCAMLGYRGPSVALSGSAFGFIWPYQYYLDNVKCLGDEPSIAACQHQGWRNENCFGTEHAGVMCSNGTKPTLPPGETRPWKITFPQGNISMSIWPYGKTLNMRLISPACMVICDCVTVNTEGCTTLSVRLRFCSASIL